MRQYVQRVETGFEISCDISDFITWQTNCSEELLINLQQLENCGKVS